MYSDRRRSPFEQFMEEICSSFDAASVAQHAQHAQHAPQSPVGAQWRPTTRPNRDSGPMPFFNPMDPFEHWGSDRRRHSCHPNGCRRPAAAGPVPPKPETKSSCSCNRPSHSHHRPNKMPQNKCGPQAPIVESWKVKNAPPVLKEKNAGPTCLSAEKAASSKENPEPTTNDTPKTNENLMRFLDNLMIGAMEGVQALKKSRQEGNENGSGAGGASPLHQFMNEIAKHSHENVDPREQFQSLMKNLLYGERSNPFPGGLFMNGLPSWMFNGCGHADCHPSGPGNPTEHKEARKDSSEQKRTSDRNDDCSSKPEGNTKEKAEARRKMMKEEPADVAETEKDMKPKTKKTVEDCQGCGAKSSLEAIGIEPERKCSSMEEQQHNEKEVVVENVDNPIRRQNGSEEYRLVLNAAEFEPDNITVRMEDGRLILEAIKESNGNDNGTKQTFRREIDLPSSVSVDRLTCSWKSNGSLIFQAPILPNKTSKTIQIHLD